ncbi:RING/FYVE/PHD-type zinc finger protein [Chloropicon primus]|uniref:RING-type E3 ubiquitin transferase n=2 Tax=Chloropicon primus TaxID=1764295 RepID=A0A5B8MCV9_9CHLO|nr:RING/FYVE/PHD-type zinc finger protein [Chloropicon primus]UPQ97236.1 RING/FYVE/PHD-type zinc finger protein [Chloropicon primus]|eukprot:QDZ18021.1 RING/FYVE/PHD-type zinc finger protein [Chloropicon primus]
MEDEEVEDFADEWRKAKGFEGVEVLEEALRCPICGDFMENPVAVEECGHSFCSLCIRRNLEVQRSESRSLESPKCPQCRGEASSSTLRMQHNLRTVVETFKALRPRLFRQLSCCQPPPSAGKPDPPPSCEEQRREDQLQAGARRRARAASPAGSGRAPGAEVWEEKLPKGKTRCPICNILVSMKLAQTHVTYCLQKHEKGGGQSSGGGAIARSPPPFSPGGVGSLPNKIQPRKLPKLVYHIIKDKELKKLLQKYKLPASGDRKTLVTRLKEFTHQYNAAVDSGKPVSMTQVASLVLKEERKRASAESRRISLPSRVEPDAEKERFASMIQEVKRRRLLEKDQDDDAAPQCQVVNLEEEEGPAQPPPNKANELVVPETLFETPSVTSGSEVDDSQDDFVIPSQLHRKALRRRWSQRIKNSQN